MYSMYCGNETHCVFTSITDCLPLTCKNCLTHQKQQHIGWYKCNHAGMPVNMKEILHGSTHSCRSTQTVNATTRITNTTSSCASIDYQTTHTSNEICSVSMWWGKGSPSTTTLRPTAKWLIASCRKVESGILHSIFNWNKLLFGSHLRLQRRFRGTGFVTALQ